MCYAFEYVMSESIQLEPMRGRVTEFSGTSEDEPRRWSYHREGVLCILRCSNAACFVLCGTLDDGSQLPSEYDDIQEVDGWHH